MFLGVLALSLTTAGFNLEEVRGRETGSPAASVVFPEESQQRDMLAQSHGTVLGCSPFQDSVHLNAPSPCFYITVFISATRSFAFSVPVCLV